MTDWTWSSPVPGSFDELNQTLNPSMKALENKLADVGETVTTLANNATPTVSASRVFKTGGTTTITDLDDGVIGQTIKILSAHAITITDGTNILLNGSTNFVMASGDVLVLTMYNDQVWVEDSRQVN